MRVLIYGINYSPELTGIGKYNGEMAEWLVACGAEVRVVTAPPYYPEWRVGEGFRTWAYKREHAGSVLIWRCPLWVPARPSGLKRLVHLASFAASSFPVMIRQMFWKPDVVLVVEPPLMCAPGALLAARLSGACSWLHVQDFEVDAAFDLGILRADWMRSLVLSVERVLMRGFRRVSTISPNMLARLHAKGVDPDRALLFPNWADLGAISPLSYPSSLRAELGIAPEVVVALYSGNMGEKQGLEIVLEAALSLSEHSEIQFVLCGEGAAKARLQERYGRLPNVQWFPLQPVERLNDLLNLADIHLLPQRADVADLVMPSKLTGMLASGRPIIATAYSDTQVAQVVEGRGVVTAPGDAGAFAKALVRLVEDKAARIVLGRAARKYAEEHLGQDVILESFMHEVELCVKQRVKANSR